MIFGDPDVLSCLAIAKQAAVEAGNFLSAQRSNSRITEENAHDLKLDVDRAAEELIIARLQSTSPFPILTEERGWVEGLNADRSVHWIVDPLDGSVNFHRGIPVCCVSIGLWNGQDPIAGSIYNFNDGEMFSGAAGIGAWLGDRRITVGPSRQPNESILFTGFPVGGDFAP